MDQKTADPPSVGTARWRTIAMQAISPRRVTLPPGLLPPIALVLRLGTAGLLVAMGWVHWHLWSQGYKFLPTNGPLFLADAIVAVVLALALVFWPRPVVGLATAGFVAGTIGALIISLTVGLFGFQESTHASYVVGSLQIESVALVLALAWTAILAVAGRIRR